MTVNRKPSGMAKSMPVGLIIGWIAEMTIMVLLCVGGTVLVLTGKIKRENIGYGTMAMLLVSSCVGATISYKAIKHQKLFVCAASGVLFIATLLGITALFFGGQYEAVGVTVLLVLGGCAAAALINPAKKLQEGKRRKLRAM